MPITIVVLDAIQITNFSCLFKGNFLPGLKRINSNGLEALKYNSIYEKSLIIGEVMNRISIIGLV